MNKSINIKTTQPYRITDKRRLMEEYINRLITNIRFDVNTGEDFFEALTREISYGDSDLEHVELGNGVDAITSRYADGFSYKEDGPYTWWDLETVWAFAKEFKMKVVALKKHDDDHEWDITDDFDDLDCSIDLDENGRVTQKEYARLARMLDIDGDPFAAVPEYSKGLNVMDYCKDIEDATVFDTVDDVEKAYNEYTDNLKEQFAYDNNILLEELDKAQKGRDKIIEQVKRKDPSEFVMIWGGDFDDDALEIRPKFSTMFYINHISYALGLVFAKD